MTNGDAPRRYGKWVTAARDGLPPPPSPLPRRHKGVPGHRPTEPLAFVLAENLPVQVPTNVPPLSCLRVDSRGRRKYWNKFATKSKG